MSKAKYKVAVVAPTCLFYQVALYRALAAHHRIDPTVYFCSSEGLYGGDVARKFHTEGRWGQEEELLKGYNHKFLRNYSPKPSYLLWPYGLINLGIWNEIKKLQPDAVILMSWMNPTWWLAILACLRYKIPFLYMTDTNVQAESLKPRWVSWTKRLLLAKGLFRLTSGFLCAGVANRDLYTYFGVPESKLVDFAFTWGYEDFFKAGERLKPQKSKIKAELGIPEKSQVILFCGRLSKEKSPQDLLEAYRRLDLPHKALVFVGDGKLRAALEARTAESNLDSIYFFGFQNRTEISKFYAIADVLVLPSSREATGGVINEAMCFGLPIIISNQVGFGMDLVQHGYNGFSYPVGDIRALASTIAKLFELPDDERCEMGSRSLELMKKWSQRDLAESLTRYLGSIIPDKALKAK